MNTPSSSPVISLVICTYNRADLMAGALASLCQQSANPADYEIIVVDNNSTDHTKEIVETYANTHTNIRYCLETKQGLSHARNCGYQNARGQYVGYLDDDAKAPVDWVHRALDLIGSKSPLVFGGPYYAFYNTPKPLWFKDAYGSREMAESTRILTGKESLSGSNMFYRRDVLEQAGGFDPNLGMKGTQQAFGEETDLQWRIRDTVPGAYIYYASDMGVYHLVRADKMSLGWNARNALRRGHYSSRTSSRHTASQNGGKKPILTGLRILSKMLYCPTLGILLRNRKRYPYAQNYVYEVLIPLVASLGKLIEVLKRKMSGREKA